MSKQPPHHLLSRLRRLVCQPGDESPSDGALLRQFAENRDEAAFTELMDRHGSLVWGVCRRVLGEGADAEDAFQATFLVLARKASAIARKDSLRAWLHGVAYRVARNAQRAGAVRRQREGCLPLREALDGNDELSWKEVRQVLDEELLRLPEKYRLPLLACYVEGKTQDEAARQLGCPLGVFRGRLDRGRERLRQRLVQRGLSLAAALTATLTATRLASAAVPARLVASTIQAATSWAMTKAAIPASVNILVEGVLRAMFWTRIKWVAAFAVSFCILTAGAALAAQQAGAPSEAEAPTPAVRKAAPQAAQAIDQVAKSLLDVHGDPLPPGALTRLGTVRGGHRGQATCLGFTPDDKTLCSFGSDHTLRLWDVATGKEIGRFHQSHFFSAQAAFTRDGKTAALLEHSTLRLCDLVTGKETRRIRLPYFAYHLAFTPDGKTLALGDDEKTVHIWDAVAGKEISKLRGHNDFVDALAFAPDGKMLASASRDNTVRLWDWAAGREIRELNHEGPVQVAFAPDGQTLAVSDNKGIHVWPVAGGKEIWRFDQKRASTSLLEFAPAGKMLAASANDSVCIWDVTTGKEIQRIDVPKEEGVRSFAFSSDGKTLAVGWGVGHLSLYDVATGKISRPLDGWRLGQIEAVAFSPDGKTAASGEQDRFIRLWDTSTGKEIGRLEGHKGQVDSVAFLADGKTLVSVGYDMTVRHWDLSTAKEIRQFKWRINKCLGKAALSADGSKMISGSGDDVLRLWDVATGKEIREFNVERGASTGPLSPDGRMLTHMDIQTIRLVDAATGAEVRQFALHNEPHTIFSAALSPDGRTLAAACGTQDHVHGSIQLWEVATGKEIHRNDKLRGSLFAVAFSPDSKMYASAGSDETIRLWETATGKEIRRWEGHEGRIMSLAFAPDGTSLASVSEDATILLWDVRRSGRPQQARNLADKELGELWTTLAGSDAGKAYAAIAALVDASRQAVPFLQRHLQPLPAIPAQRLADLIADLDSPQFATRQKATEEMEKLGPATEAALRKVLTGKISLETQQRLEQLLTKATALTPDRLRELRAIEALEWMATPEAKQLLQTLAKESGYPQRTREDAEAARSRLVRRGSSN